jgi:hypothetical protein
VTSLESKIARAKPPQLTKLRGDLQRVQEQIHSLSAERTAKAEFADPAFSTFGRPKLPEAMAAAGKKVQEIDGKLAALQRSADDIRRQIAEWCPMALAALDGVRLETERDLIKARDDLYRAIANYNAVTVARIEVGAGEKVLPAIFPHVDQALRHLVGPRQ